MKRDINADEDTEKQSDIVCPYCGHEHAPSDVRPDVSADEDEFTHECDSCGKEFNGTLHVSYAWTTARKRCKAGEHDYQLDDMGSWVYSGRNYTCYKCSKCLEEQLPSAPAAADGVPFVVPLDPEEGD